MGRIIIALILVHNGFCYWGADVGSRYILWADEESGKRWVEVGPGYLNGGQAKRVVRV